jgi:hypothetical protein
VGGGGKVHHLQFSWRRGVLIKNFCVSENYWIKFVVQLFWSHIIFSRKGKFSIPKKRRRRRIFLIRRLYIHWIFSFLYLKEIEEEKVCCCSIAECCWRERRGKMEITRRHKRMDGWKHPGSKKNFHFSYFLLLF